MAGPEFGGKIKINDDKMNEIIEALGKIEDTGGRFVGFGASGNNQQETRQEGEKLIKELEAAITKVRNY